MANQSDQMTQRNPTNSDIFEKLGKLEAVQIATLEQVQKTNGRVTKLEKWKDKLDVIADYKKENTGILTSGSDKSLDSQKIIMYALGLLGTALAIILALSNGK